MKLVEVILGSIFVHSLSCVQLCNPMELQHSRLPCPLLSRSLLKFMFFELMMPSNQLIFCHPLLLSSLFPSIRIFSSESALCIKWPNYCGFNISPSDEYAGLISFRWFGSHYKKSTWECITSFKPQNSLNIVIIVPFYNGLKRKNCPKLDITSITSRLFSRTHRHYRLLVICGCVTNLCFGLNNLFCSWISKSV